MLTLLYPLSFLVSLTGLIAWFYVQDEPEKSSFASKVFLGGFFVYLGALAFTEVAFGDKLMILFRDFIVLAVVSQFFGFLRKHKTLFLVMMVLLYGTFHFYYKDLMIQSIAPTSSNTVDSYGLELDKEGELLVELKEGLTPTALAEISAAYGLTFRPAFTMKDVGATDLDDYFVVDIKDNDLRDLDKLMLALEQTGNVDWVEENEVVKVAPISPVEMNIKGSKFGLNDPGVEQLWAFEALHIEELYATIDKNKIKAKKVALIAILDTGVDAKHEDIKGNFKSIKSKHDNDPQAHGTHCAGIAGAVSNNGKGIASFSRNNEFVQISSVKVLNRFGMGTQQSIVNGMLEAVDAGADVLSMSLGGKSNPARQKAYQKAVEYATKKGVIVVVAAGNSNQNAKEHSPANAKGVIVVSAVDEQLNKAPFSNTVEDLEMGLAAPGVGIYSTIPNNKYAALSGTSMATPYVAGLVGLMKSIKPDLTTKEAYQFLKNTGTATQAKSETGPLIDPAKVIEKIAK